MNIEKNSLKKQIMEFVVNELLSEAITNIGNCLKPPFVDIISEEQCRQSYSTPLNRAVKLLIKVLKGENLSLPPF